MNKRIDWGMRQFIDEAMLGYKPENRIAVAKKFYDRGVPVRVALRMLK